MFAKSKAADVFIHRLCTFYLLTQVSAKLKPFFICSLAALRTLLRICVLSFFTIAQSSSFACAVSEKSPLSRMSLSYFRMIWRPRMFTAS